MVCFQYDYQPIPDSTNKKRFSLKFLNYQIKEWPWLLGILITGIDPWRYKLQSYNSLSLHRYAPEYFPTTLHFLPSCMAAQKRYVSYNKAGTESILKPFSLHCFGQLHISFRCFLYLFSLIISLRLKLALPFYDISYFSHKIFKMCLLYWLHLVIFSFVCSQGLVAN